ncbi:hypothetical protein [Deinococcus sp. Marseille-Q6407]|uniref:hypothetical protein n=1 Tax=Deinococcus sp. Marseille-Q6407 TaxID=2969223 RepID=UPI0021C21246|nr:hypothetical protein [Deinococcus sp. Marseille-Q6407]
MTKYMLKDDALDGIYDQIGEVRHGQVITPAYPEQEEVLKADSRFKQYRGPAPEAANPGEPVTTSATVEDAEADAPAKPAKKAKE